MAKSQTISDADARRFPVLTPPHWKREYPAIPASVPWHLVAPHEKQAKTNHSQTLERLAQRGGLSVLEIHDVFHGHGYGTMRDVPAAVAFCIALNTPKEEPEPMNEDEPKPTAVNPVGAFCIGDLRQWAEDALTAGYPPQTPLYVGFGDAVTAGRESPLIPVRGLLLDKVRVHSDGEAVRPRNDADEDAGTHPGVILLLQQGTVINGGAFGVRLSLMPHTLFLLPVAEAGAFLSACGMELSAPPVPLPDWKAFLLFLAREEAVQEESGREPIKAIRTPLAPFSQNSPALSQTFYCSPFSVQHARSMESLRKSHGRRLWPDDERAGKTE
jgi:hypothetical protein